VLEVPDGPVAPSLFPLETSGIVAMVSALLAGALACWLVRFVVGVLLPQKAPPADDGRRRRPVPGIDGLAVATGVWICGLAAITWAMNPYAAGVLVLATHLWLFSAGGWRGWPAVVAVLVGLAPIVLVAVYYCLALGLSPLELAWGAALAAGTGAGMWSTLLLAGVLAALAGTIRVLFARGRLARDETPSGSGIKTRGPVSYAGPGSLGGTESALRR